MQGRVTTGEGRAAAFVPEIADLLSDAAGFRPFPGTMNLEGLDDLDELPVHRVQDPDLGLDNCRGVDIMPCAVAGVRGAVVRPIVDDYPVEKVEVVAPVHLRRLLGLRDGDGLSLAGADDMWTPDGPSATVGELDQFDAVVFDLDGTLVDLRVDWSEVKDAIDDLLGEHLSEPVGSDEVDLQAVAREHGQYDRYVDLLATYEREGARRAGARPLLSALPSLACPVGICTKNSVSAADRVLGRFDVRSAVDAVVGRETTQAAKPDPAPVWRCLAELGVEPGGALFVGDDPSDCEAATRAGTSFLHPDRIRAT